MTCPASPRIDLLEYLRRYADNFDVRKYLRFRHQVLSVTPVDPDLSDTKWSVNVKDLSDDSETTEVFGIVIVCNGHFNQPYVPRLTGIQFFKGKVMHSCDYRVPESFTDQRVLIVGGGPSARDIAQEIMHTARHVVITPSTYSTTYQGTFPNVSVTSLPVAFTDSGSLRLLPSAKSGTDAAVAEINKDVEVDVVILGTGYQFNIPFISSYCGVNSTRGRVTPLYCHIINCNYPTMAFIGLITGLPVLGAGVEDQVLFYKAYLDGEMKLPSVDQMKRECETDYRQRREYGLPERDAHYMGAERIFDYCRLLAKEGGFAPVEPVAEEMFIAHAINVQIDPINFRHYEYTKTSVAHLPPTKSHRLVRMWVLRKFSFAF